MEKPIVKYITLPSGSKLIRFSSLSDVYYYDEYSNNPNGIAMHRSRSYDIDVYKRERLLLDSRKLGIIQKAQKEMSLDQDFLKLVYKGKSQKRKFELNKFVGNLSMVQYATGSDKMFARMVPGAKKQTLNLAFQVGTFMGGDYQGSFIKILKTIMMCQAMNISVNIDMFDSDTNAIDYGNGYILVNIAKSSEKLNFKEILAASHEQFFNYTLFNGYSASGCQKRIGTFVPSSLIIRDLGPMYDVIGGNLLSTSEAGKNEMVSKILKIGLR